MASWVSEERPEFPVIGTAPAGFEQWSRKRTELSSHQTCKMRPAWMSLLWRLRCHNRRISPQTNDNFLYYYGVFWVWLPCFCCFPLINIVVYPCPHYAVGCIFCGFKGNQKENHQIICTLQSYSDIIWAFVFVGSAYSGTWVFGRA